MNRSRDDARRNTDRTVHATSPDGLSEVVRYDRAGRFRLETWGPAGEPTGSAPLTLASAVETAHAWHLDGGHVHLRRPGGLRFDAAYRQRVAADHPAAPRSNPTTQTQES